MTSRSDMKSALLLVLGILIGAAIAGARAQSLWLTPGAVSWHADRSAGYNERNHGIGAEWHSASAEHRISAGTYRNSIHRDTRYALYSWAPLQTTLGQAKLAAGIAIGIADGYQVNHGRAFPVALPALSVEIWRIGINLTAWPKVEKDASAGVAVQFRVKVF